MKNFARHWKKGWKFLLLELCLNVAYVLIILPVYVITRVMLSLSIVSYNVVIFIVGLILVPAVTHYIFEIFYGTEVYKPSK